jgi:peptide/nickel transport system substrate-binding protein
MPSRDERSGRETLLFPRRRNFLRALGIGATGALAGCAGGEETTTVEDGGATTATNETAETAEPANRQVLGDYIAPDATDATTMLWLNVSDQPTANRVGLALDSAYTITTDFEVFPLWADISSDDDRVYEVELRENLRWGADYGQMTAEDWVYLITEVFQAEDNWAGFPSQSDWQQTNPESGESEFVPVERTGEYTFEIQLFDVDPAFPLKPVMWGQFCMPKGLLEPYVEAKDLEGLKQDEEVQTLAYAGNLGPYSYENWERESEFVATRNEEYYMTQVEGTGKFDNVTEAWKGAPYHERYVYRVIPEESTRLAALREGEVTSSGIPETKVSQFEGRDGLYVNVSPQPFNSLLIYNQRVNGNFYEAFRKRSVRQALARVVNKRAIVENILRGYGNVAHTFQPRFSRWYNDEKIVETGVGDAYDPEGARNTLENELGDTPYEYDGDTVVDTETGDPVELRLVYPVGTETTKTTCEYIKQEYSQVGLNVTLNGVQFNTLIGKYAQNTYDEGLDPNGEREYDAGPFNRGDRDEATSAEPWEMHYGIVFNTYPRTPSSTRDFWVEQGGINYYGYVPETDFASLYADASSEQDDERRKDIYGDIFGALTEEQPCNFLNMGVDVVGYQDYVEGPTEEFGAGWDGTTWYFDPAAFGR